MDVFLRLFRWTWGPLALLALAIAFESFSFSEHAAQRLAPPRPAASSDEVLYARAEAKCLDKLEYFEKRNCAYEVRNNKYDLTIEQAIEAEAFDSVHINPTVDRIDRAVEFVTYGLFFLLSGLFVWNIAVTLRHFYKNSRFITSRTAEAEVMRFKRLFDNGLITQAEFDAKKVELKEKLLA